LFLIFIELATRASVSAVLAKRRFGWNWKPGVLNKGNLKRLDSS